MALIDNVKGKIKNSEKFAIDAIYRSRIYPGLSLYNKLQSKYSTDTYIFLCPYVGTGDVYLASLYMENYALKIWKNFYI